MQLIQRRTAPPGGEDEHTPGSQLFLLEEFLPGRHDVLVDLINLFRLLYSVSEKRRLMLAVVKQDVKGHLAAHHVLDGGLHHTVEVSRRVRVIQHVVDLVFLPQKLQRVQFDL